MTKASETSSTPRSPATASSFDQHINRHQSSSEKWLRYQGHNIIPMWVADTDFLAPPAVLKALHQRIDHGVFGYTLAPDELIQTVIKRFSNRYHWQLKAEWLEWLPGLVCGLHLACRATGSSGTSVIAPTPIYGPFMTSPSLSDRQLIKVPLRLKEQRWVLDFDQLEQSISKDTELILFCNPQNPGGSCYREDELLQLINICERHDLILCSDEIHCDLILEPGVQHIPIASLSEAAAQRTITLVAPSKTFNIAGLGCSLAIIANDELRRRFKRVRKGIVSEVNLLGYTAALAAYQDGDDWNQQQLEYLRANRDLLVKEINQIPGLSLQPFEATYLAWIDVSALQLDNPPAFFEQAGVGMSPGKEFGDKRFMRLNFGCPRPLLQQAIERIRSAVIEQATQP